MSSVEEQQQFQRYDEEFTSLIQQIETSLQSSDEESQQRHYSQSHTDNLLQQCDDLIKQMSLEARSVSNTNLKRKLLDEVKTYKSKYRALRSESDRCGLMKVSSGSSRGGGGNTPDQQKRRLLDNEDSLNRQNETLERARRTMEETEQVALEITEELGSNREKLETTHGRIREVSGLAGRARRVLTSMNQRATRQKLVLYGVAFALILGFVVLLYSMWR